MAARHVTGSVPTDDSGVTRMAVLECQAACWGDGGPGHELRNKAQCLAVDVAKLATTIRVWGAVVSLLLVLVGGLGVWAVRGIAGEVRGRQASGVLVGEAHAEPRR
jgi:hypothetical protein